MVESPLFDRLVTCFSLCGNRSRAERVLSSVFFSFKLLYGSQYLSVIERAVENLSPQVSLRGKKRAGISYRIPFALPGEGTALSYALRWLRHSTFNRREKSLSLRIFRELQDALVLKGEAFRKKEALHQVALLNRGFIRFLR